MVRTLVLMAAVLAAGGAGWSRPQSAQSAWPVIKSFSKVFEFRDGSNASVSLPIRDLEGKLQYRLECHTFLFEGDESFDYSGDFECKLTPANASATVPTLLTSDPSQPRDWWSRGRFLAEELEGPCADYPEYGRSRSFRLRGMALRLELSNIRMATPSEPGRARSKPRFLAFRFKITADADPTATSELAECPKVQPCYRSSPPCFSRSIP